MRTTVFTAQERRQRREAGDRLARMCQIRLISTVSMLTALFTRVIPLCGSAGWWMGAVCMLPGLATYGLLCAAIRSCGAKTLQEAVLKKCGRAGETLVRLLLGVLFLLEGAGSLTALVTAFTEGIGTEGTQFTMALLTLGAAVLCLHRDALARGIWLMRRGMLLAALVIAALLAGMLRPDGLHPVLGPGGSSLQAAWKAGCTLAWPLILLLTAEPAKGGRLRAATVPVFFSLGTGAALCLIYPCEMLIRETGLAGTLLLPARHLPAAAATAAHCLGMLGAFLSIASCLQLGAQQLEMRRRLNWLPFALAGLLALLQLIPARRLWLALTGIMQYAPVLLSVWALILVIRRKKCAE